MRKLNRDGKTNSVFELSIMQVTDSNLELPIWITLGVSGRRLQGFTFSYQILNSAFDAIAPQINKLSKLVMYSRCLFTLGIKLV